MIRCHFASGNLPGARHPGFTARETSDTYLRTSSERRHIDSLGPSITINFKSVAPPWTFGSSALTVSMIVGSLVASTPAAAESMDAVVLIATRIPEPRDRIPAEIFRATIQVERVIGLGGNQVANAAARVIDIAHESGNQMASGTRSDLPRGRHRRQCHSRRVGDAGQ